MRTHLVLIAAVLGLLPGCQCGGGPVPDLPEKNLGSCNYKNNFSGGQECRDYLGEWTEKAATDDCKGQSSNLQLAKACGVADSNRLGYCIFTKSPDTFVRVSVIGTDSSKCASMKRGCEFFGGGVFDPSPLCGGVAPTDPDATTGLPVFQMPRLNCVDPKPGEPPGQSANGQVCTWEAISGATEEGRHFEDYASCDRVRTQRPYYPVPPAGTAGDADPRLSNAAYVTELEWVKSQIRSTACVCCHSTLAPKGTSNWFLESGPNFANSMYPRGLAIGAGWIDSTGFGAYPKEQNNGFTRPSPEHPEGSGFTTTDVARITAFFEGELMNRGYARADFANAGSAAGPLDLQRAYQPTACTNGEGVGPDGTVTWVGGKARYVQVLEASARSPGVPPNLDLPAGTLWRLDVPFDQPALESGSVRYGVVSAPNTQGFPAQGSPAALLPGTQYYLYVLLDVGNPVTRCLFTMR